MPQHHTPDFDLLQSLVDHRFTRHELLAQALTHSSAKRKRVDTSAPTSTQSYERLEFLGDRVLGLCVADMLCVAFPNEPEGHLAKRHALLVSKPTLAAIARQLQLQRFIMVSVTERQHGGLENDGLLSDVVESLIAAMYLDAGMDPALRFIEKHWKPKFSDNKRPPRDAKTALQEWSQGLKQILPSYEVVDHSGPSHRPSFEVRVSVEGFGHANGKGASKREAERNAAAALVQELQSKGVIKGQQS